MSTEPATDRQSGRAKLASRTATPPIQHVLSIDVEDYFQVSAFQHRVTRDKWDSYECRVEQNTDRLLSLFDRCEVQGTFFILGWVADRYPDLVKRIAKAGHEIASHGYWHQLVYSLAAEEFAADIQKSKEAIANACGIVPTAYRAPSFSIVPKSYWALEILVEYGFTVDSSIFPIGGHDLYGDPDARKEIHFRETPRGAIREFPPSAWSSGKLHVPVGGGYFRIFPEMLTSKAIRKVTSEGRPAMFYLHPWEIDPDQPRITGAGLKSRLRHYTGLASTEAKLERLLSRFSFGTMRNVIRQWDER